MERDYHFIRVIGEGAFSRVYLVEDRNGRQYACKVSSKEKMLKREAEILSRLYHPLFPAYISFEEGKDAGRLIMEYIPGINLRRMAQLRGGFSARQATKIAGELADGLRYLHERQPTIVYRDLKPENIMVCQNGHIKLIDLGCACYQDEQGGVKAGTPGFAPPEQLAAGGIAGIYSDVYGLGKTIQSVMKMGTKCRGKGRKWRSEERKYRRKLEHVMEESTHEDWKQRPQDMISVLHILNGKSKCEKGVICVKNIWESSYKNSCSLPLI